MFIIEYICGFKDNFCKIDGRKHKVTLVAKDKATRFKTKEEAESVTNWLGYQTKIREVEKW